MPYWPCTKYTISVLVGVGLPLPFDTVASSVNAAVPFGDVRRVTVALSDAEPPPAPLSSAAMHPADLRLDTAANTECAYAADG